MPSSIREILQKPAEALYGADAQAILAYLPAQPIQPQRIRAVLINEVVADSPDNDFYSTAPSPAYMETTIPLFARAGVAVHGIDDITARGIYITSAVKLPKAETTVSNETIDRYVPLLERELALFDRLQAIMLMGDVAKKAFNRIAKARTGKNAIPSGATYRLRANEYFVGDIRVFPAYIMTGKNILIEKSKVEMSAEDIARMLAIIGTP